MKNIWKFIVALTVCVVATGAISCSNNDKTDKNISVAPATLHFSDAGGNATVTVTGELQWTVTPSVAWMSVKQADADFTVTVTANDTAEPRTGTILVDNGVNTATIAVTQDVNALLAGLIGEWHLTRWTGDKPEGFDIYLAFMPHAAVDIYQQLAEVNAYDHYSGSYRLDGDVLSGMYSDGTAWNSSYHIAIDEDAATLTMTCTIDADDVSVYAKTTIPDKVKTGVATTAATRAIGQLPL